MLFVLLYVFPGSFALSVSRLEDAEDCRICLTTAATHGMQGIIIPADISTTLYVQVSGDFVGLEQEKGASLYDIQRNSDPGKICALIFSSSVIDAQSAANTCANFAVS